MQEQKNRSDEATVNEKLARDRTLMANERTFLAYVRTSMMFLISGATVIKLFGAADFWNMFWGCALLIIGILLFLIGFLRFQSTRRRTHQSLQKDAEK